MRSELPERLERPLCRTGAEKGSQQCRSRYRAREINILNPRIGSADRFP